MSFRVGNIEVEMPEPEVFDTRDVSGDLPPERLLRAQRAVINIPSPENIQKLRAVEVINTAYWSKLTPTASRRLATLVKARTVPCVPEDAGADPVGVALRKLRRATTDQGKKKAREALEEARVELAILKAREAGLDMYWRRRVASALLRGVTS